jgi:N-ethylmaleimide reductase
MVMAPMTRRRGGEGGVPTRLTAEYYRQRASAGLVVTEAAPVERRGQGVAAIPGIFDDRQEEGWRRVVDAVHGAGGRIFQQLWHAGRVAHPDNVPGASETVAPSPVAIEDRVETPGGPKPYPVPRPLKTDEVRRMVARYREAAERARRAGFDGVELHASHGYLVDQFLRDATNRREDRYGGSRENRVRFLEETTGALCDVFGPERVGVQLSPLSQSNQVADAHPRATFERAARVLGELGVVYLHLAGLDAGEEDGSGGNGEHPLVAGMRDVFGGTVILNGGFDRALGNRALRAGRAHLISFGRLFLANPDLPERFARSLPVNRPDPETFYGRGPRGYTDYPTWEELQEGAEAPAGLVRRPSRSRS